MNSSIAHISNHLLSKIANLVERRTGRDAIEIGMILMQNHKHEYQKAGIQVASDVISFIVFDETLKKMTVIKRSDLTPSPKAISHE